MKNCVGRSPLRIAQLYLFFIVPAVGVYALFVLAPLLQTIVLGLYEWNGVSPHRIFVGISNYIELFHDPRFWIALRNNLYWIIASVVNPMFVGLVLAVFLSSIKVGQKAYLTIYFVPVVLPLIMVGLTWGVLYNPLIGPINRMLEAFGLQTQGWLGDPRWATPAVIIAGNWTFFGFCTVIFLAGLQAIDASLLEASMIDGAEPITRFFRIILPLLRDQINIVFVFSIIGSFKVFDIVYIMTQGGPSHSSEVMATYLYWQAFNNGRVGYGSAIAFVLICVVSAISLLYFRLREDDK